VDGVEMAKLADKYARQRVPQPSVSPWKAGSRAAGYALAGIFLQRFIQYDFHVNPRLAGTIAIAIVGSVTGFVYWWAWRDHWKEYWRVWSELNEQEKKDPEK